MACHDEAIPTLENVVNPHEVSKDLPVQVLCVGALMRIQINSWSGILGKFYSRTWNEYRNGFGDYFSSFWIGNELLHVLTASKMYTLMFCAVSITLNYTNVCVSYNNSTILSENENYTLVLGPMAPGSNASLDISAQHNNTAFTTSDRDNDNNSTGNCATIQGGGFWYNNCFLISPNGRSYSNFTVDQKDGIIYPAFNGYLPLAYITMYLQLP